MRADEQEANMRRERRSSGPPAAKTKSIKSAKRKFAGGASRAVELTSGDLEGGPNLGLG